jgi:hypothetical protein
MRDLLQSLGRLGEEAPASRARARVPRFALSKAEAAEALGVSVDFLEDHVLPELRVVYRGRRRLVPVTELEGWLAREATRPIEGR